jgi:hypothetical protein
MKKLHGVPYTFKRWFLNQMARTEPSRIVDQVRCEMKQPGIERSFVETNRPEVNICYDG